MAEQTKKSKYNFGGHELDAKLYLQNIRDNAETFLNSKTDWTPEQKEEWKHAYTNFTNALQEDINNGGGRFSTDEFGTIIDTKGEFSNTDSDNYYYNNKGQQISQEDYDALKKRKQGKYQTFEANRQFASYANQIGKGLREALAAKNKTSDDTNGFDYAKNGFDAYWQKKYNPAGTANDLQPYWNKDKEGEYTNRVAETIADLDDYMSKQEMNDDVKAAYTNYRNILGQYNPSDKNFNLDTWKNNMILAASRAGISGWNNGYFNIGSQSTTPTEDKKPEAFDINNDQAVIDKYKLADQIAAHPEQREHLLDLARRRYNQESQAMTDEYNTAIKQEQEIANNKIWQQYLANEGKSYANVSKRNFGTEVFGNGWQNGNTDFEYTSRTSQEAMRRLQNAFKTGNRKGDFLRTAINMTVNGGKQKISNLGEALAYYKPLLDKTQGGWDQFEKVQDAAGNEIYKLKGSENAKGQPLYIWFKNGKAHAYRDDPYSVRKAQIISRAQLGMKLQTREEKEAAKQKENNKVINNPQTPHDRKVALTKQQKIGGNPFSDRATFLRTTALATDVGALVASFSGVGAPASALVGAAATAQNQAADMAEGQGFWESLGNNALGYGMDALSVIPFVRGITGTGRIIKTASKLAPHIITALGAISALKNKDAYLNSWHKVTSNPSQLNRQDWSNIYDSLRLVISGTTAGTQAIKGNKAMKGALSKDKVKVKTNEGYVVVDKSKLEGIKGTKGLEAQNKALQEATGNSNLRFSAARNKYRFWKTKDQAKIREADVYDFTKPNTRMINGVEYERPYKWGELGIANHQWQAPKWMNGILDKIEVSGLKPTGRTQADIDYGNRRISQNFSVAELRELSNQISPVVTEWKSLKTQAQSARKNAAEALSKARKATDSQIKANYENSAKSYLDYIRNKATEYQKLKGVVKDGKVTFHVGDNYRPVEIAWNDILRKYGIKYKQGGSIQKLASGNSINGSPAKQNSVGYANDYNWNTDVFSKNLDHILGSLKQYKDGYANWLNTMQDLHYNDYTNASKQDYLNTNAYNNVTVGQYQDKYKAGYEDEWNVSPEGNDPDGLGYNTLGIKSAQDSGKFGIVSGKANSGDWLGNGNMYKTDNSFGGITDARRLLGREGDFNDEQLKQYQQKFKEQGYDFYLDPNTKYYKLKPYTDPSKTTVADQNNKPKQSNNFSLKDVINKMDVTDKWGIPRAMYADITNRKVTDMLKKQPLLLDPQEDHRYIQSDLDAEMNGQQAAAQLARTASHPITSDGNLQSMLQLEAVSKGNDAITAGRQQSNQRLREMQEQAWQQEVANHTNRHNVAMQNRQSIYNTANENKALEAAYLNQKFTVWDALAQEKEFKAKSDYEQMRARADQFAQGDINNTIKYGLSNYVGKYGLTPEDVSLWDKVYTDGTVKLSDIQKDPIKLRQWNKVLSATRQIQQDLLGEYYGIPKSKYWTIRQSTPSYNYSTEVKEAKKGAKLNLHKVREAAKGEKLAAAQLKAQTADADRFYKTTKDHIDRMYDAINRLTNYSSTKKKRKKKKNYDI